MRKVVLALGVASILVAAPAAARSGDRADTASGRYIVTLAPELPRVGERAESLTRQFDGDVTNVYRHALRGFAVGGLSPADAAALEQNPQVVAVAPDLPLELRADQTQANPPNWGLDRIDQRDLPLSASFTQSATGQGVTIYVLDSGIRRTHDEFSGRVTQGPGPVGPSGYCDGHGTRVAGIAAGETFGVAKDASLVALPAMCSGVESEVIAAIDWVTADHDPGELAVVNMSFGKGGLGPAEEPVETAVKNSVADGVVYVGAAANQDADVCSSDFPSRVVEVITVSSTTVDDRRRSTGAYGSCIDVFAPGSDIATATSTSDQATSTASGTSEAAPHVAGVAALYLEAHPTATPAQVMSRIVDTATTGKLTNSDGSPLPAGTPNRLLYAPLSRALTVTKAGAGTGTVSSVPEGISCGASCAAHFDAATPVMLTAIPAANAKPVQWSGCDSVDPDGRCLVEMSAARQVTATFEPADPVPPPEPAEPLEPSQPPDRAVTGASMELRKLVLRGEELQVKLGVRCAEVCTHAASGQVVVETSKGKDDKGKSFKLSPASATTAAGEQGALTLKLAGAERKRTRATRQIAAALEESGKAFAAVAVDSSDGAGNSTTQSARAKIKLP